MLLLFIVTLIAFFSLLIFAEIQSRRTIRMQDGQVNDHVDGRSWRLKKYL